MKKSGQGYRVTLCHDELQLLAKVANCEHNSALDVRATNEPPQFAASWMGPTLKKLEYAQSLYDHFVDLDLRGDEDATRQRNLIVNRLLELIDSPLDEGWGTRFTSILPVPLLIVIGCAVTGRSVDELWSDPHNEAFPGELTKLEMLVAGWTPPM
jgi:hypothetical protein